jgi:hypothetical protein
MNENFMDSHFIPDLPTTKVKLKCYECDTERECDSNISGFICAKCLLAKSRRKVETK